MRGRERVYRLDHERLAAVVGRWIARFATGSDAGTKG
jgi:hypothetical protein